MTTASFEVEPLVPSESDTDTTQAVTGPRAGHAKRRTFTAEYKRQIVAEYDAAPKGHKGVILRRERLYDSHILEWRHAITAGTLETGKRQGRQPGSGRSVEQKRIVELERETVRLRREVARRDEVIADREAALEVLGKGVAFLEVLSSRNAR
jgi:transposase